LNYRSPKILKAARDSLSCHLCDKNNDGTVVAAHSNRIADGKGMGIKAHDYRVAFLCHDCHQKIDAGKLSRENKIFYWELAHRKTIGWLFESGVIK